MEENIFIITVNKMSWFLLNLAIYIIELIILIAFWIQKFIYNIITAAIAVFC